MAVLQTPALRLACRPLSLGSHEIRDQLVLSADPLVRVFPGSAEMSGLQEG